MAGKPESESTSTEASGDTKQDERTEMSVDAKANEETMEVADETKSADGEGTVVPENKKEQGSATKEVKDDEMETDANKSSDLSNENKEEIEKVEGVKEEESSNEEDIEGDGDTGAETKNTSVDEGKTIVENVANQIQPPKEHPYKDLIDNYKIPPLCLTKVNKIKTKHMDNVSCMFVSTKALLIELVERLMPEKEIGVAVRYNAMKYNTVLCLILISTRRTNYIIDAIALKPSLHMLDAVFASPNIIKVAFAAKRMIKYCQLAANLWFVNLFDIRIAMEKLGIKESYKTFMEQKYKIFDSPKHTLIWWHRRPLPENHKTNAIIGMHYLVPTYFHLKNKLIDLKLIESVLMECNELCGRVFTHPTVDTIFEDMQFMKPSQVYALYALDKWRHSIAQKKKKNVNIILDITKLKKLVNIMPMKQLMIQEIADTPQVTSRIKEVHAIFLEAQKVIGPVNSRFNAGVKLASGDKSKPKDKQNTGNAKGRKNKFIPKRLQDKKKGKNFGAQKTDFKRNRFGRFKGQFNPVPQNRGPMNRPKVFESPPRPRSPTQPFLEIVHGLLDQFRSTARQFRERSRSPVSRYNHRSPPRSNHDYGAPFRGDDRDMYRNDDQSVFRNSGPRQPVWESPRASRNVWENERGPGPSYHSRESRDYKYDDRNGYRDSGYGRNENGGSYGFRGDGPSRGGGSQGDLFNERAIFVPIIAGSGGYSNQAQAVVSYPKYNPSRYSNQGF